MKFDSSCKLRIPPSPTGELHLGTARTALYNLLIAKRYGGKFLFRLEDTDKERSKSEYVTDILDGFEWLGITWDEGPFRQSEHLARHRMVVDEMLRNGLAYECFCSSEELDELRAFQRSQNQLEGYDNRHRNLTEEQKEEFRKQGRKPVIRFKLPDNKDVIWEDLVKGKMIVSSSDLGGDPVIAKESTVLYNFAVVVDDHDGGVTHVIRGEDHLHNTAKQILLYEALNWPVPVFGHVPLILTATREKLSKRKHGDIAGVKKYRAEGYLSEAVVNYIISMSWNFADEKGEEKEVFSLEEAIRNFDIEKISKSPAVYDAQKLEWFCKEHFKRLSEEEVLKRAEPFLSDLIKNSEQKYSHEELTRMISLIKDGLVKLSEIPEKLEFFFKNLDKSRTQLLKDFPDSNSIFSVALELLQENKENEKLDGKVLLEKISEKTGIKKSKKLFFPLRIAVSGFEHGPDLTSIFEILGKESLTKRIRECLV